MNSSIKNSVSSACSKQIQKKLLNEVFKLPIIGTRLDDTSLENIQKYAEWGSMGALLIPGFGLPASRALAGVAALTAGSRLALQNQSDLNLAKQTKMGNFVDAIANTTAATSFGGIAGFAKNTIRSIPGMPSIGTKYLSALRTRRIQDLSDDELRKLNIDLSPIRQTGSKILMGPSSVVPKGGGPSVYSSITNRHYKLNDKLDSTTASAIGYTDPASGFGPGGKEIYRKARSILDPLTDVARRRAYTLDGHPGPSWGQLFRAYSSSELSPVRDTAKSILSGGPTELTTKRLIPGGPTRMDTVLDLYGRGGSRRTEGGIGQWDFSTSNFLPIN